MSQYVSLAALKLAIGDPDTVDDVVLSSAIIRASAMVDSYLSAVRPGYVGIAAGSNFVSAVGSNSRTYHGTGSDTLFIDDAMSVSSIVIDGTAITSTAYVAEPLNSVPKRFLTYISPSTPFHGLGPSIWTRGTANVVVTGYWGLNFVPDDVEQVALGLAVLIWGRYQQGKPVAFWGPTDPEAMAILANLDYGWRIETVRGG